ncbi:CRISPR-associated endonuclease Cas2 [Mycoplasma sp. Mirounga ES2805-ORL]|uniref:CRISPR-associated endonuclease Cas2 n=1 Tax=Mycoplasma sp. Mirounga ES2805-ORL TaxID=754514 RepID=UPI0027386299|nr:CRISPR-associated endonuclease Cas2 [Mycoplasma sp. Mirounga ES2805-ORL]
MRIIIMYDVCMDNKKDIQNYQIFKNNLTKLGYYMIQYSIYGKCVSSHTVYEYEKKKILNIIPQNSNVRFFMITESQYQNIEILSGQKSLSEIYNGQERYIKL